MTECCAMRPEVAKEFARHRHARVVLRKPFGVDEFT